VEFSLALQSLTGVRSFVVQKNGTDFAGNQAHFSPVKEISLFFNTLAL
jgi:hypothetical protein